MDSTDAPASEIASLREQPAALTSGEVKPEKEELDECVICMEVCTYASAYYDVLSENCRSLKIKEL